MPTHPIFHGTATALVTPFTTDDRLDIAALRGLIDFQLAGNVEAIVLLGTTGENPTITDLERDVLTQTVIEYVNGRVPVIVGTGTNSTAQSIIHARRAQLAGASAQLVVAPYYNKPTQAGIRAHVEAIADATDLPIILYNVPGRTSVNISADTTLSLASSVPSVVAIKEASGDLGQIGSILNGRDDGFAVYSGDDELALPMISLGGDGCVSVISNALPAPYSALIRAALCGDSATAIDLQRLLLGAMRACFVETNPIPIKAMLGMTHLITPGVRLPLTPISAASMEVLRSVFTPFVESMDSVAA